MKLCIQVVILAVFVSTMAAFGQLACGTATTPAACPDDSFQIKYAANLGRTLPTAIPALGESEINATNTGAQAGVAGTIGFTGGNLCLNFYVFDPGEEELACCSCSVTPNGLISTTVKGMLLGNPLTPEQPTSAVIKVLVTNQATCNAGSVTSAELVSGARIWGTTIHSSTGTNPVPPTGFPFGTETEFSKAGSTLSVGELNRMVNYCSLIGGYSGYGVCPALGGGAACSTGGLGAVGQ